MSDTILASIVGIIAAALPPSNAEIDNTLQDNLGAKPSLYRAVGPLNVPLYQLGQSGETACAQIDICSNGCVAFVVQTQKICPAMYAGMPDTEPVLPVTRLPTVTAK